MPSSQNTAICAGLQAGNDATSPAPSRQVHYKLATSPAVTVGDRKQSAWASSGVDAGRVSTPFRERASGRALPTSRQAIPAGRGGGGLKIGSPNRTLPLPESGKTDRCKLICHRSRR